MEKAMTNRYGYCCINLTLQKSRGIMTNRTMRRKTFDAKGLGYVSELSLKNTTDLKEIIQWNSENGFEVFRITSTMFPWASEYDWNDLPDIDAIRENLRQAGQLARDTGQRLSFHPGPFNCLASPKEDVVLNCVKDLSIHGDQMDMLGMPRTHEAKINIHIGAAYGDREKALDTWCRNFERLPENVKCRLTVENDDRGNLYSTKMLYESVYKRLGIPIVFDGFHYLHGPQDSSYEEAFLMAYDTWPKGIRPVCHHSNSRKKYEDSSCRSLAAHSDYYYEPFDSCGKSVDVAMEAKAKELAVFDYLQKFEVGPKCLVA
jgi:UV DNA damage endonuclease